MLTSKKKAFTNQVLVAIIILGTPKAEIYVQTQVEPLLNMLKCFLKKVNALLQTSAPSTQSGSDVSLSNLTDLTYLQAN